MSNTCVKLYRNWMINEVARAGEHTNERTYVHTYVLTYIRTGQTLFPLHNFVVRGDKKRKEKRKYVARPGIEPRTPDLRVRCPTDCATRPGKWSDNGIRVIYDIIGDDGEFYTFEELKAMSNIRGTFLDYQRIVNSIPQTWKTLINNN